MFETKITARASPEAPRGRGRPQLSTLRSSGIGNTFKYLQYPAASTRRYRQAPRNTEIRPGMPGGNFVQFTEFFWTPDLYAPPRAAGTPMRCMPERRSDACWNAPRGVELLATCRRDGNTRASNGRAAGDAEAYKPGVWLLARQSILQPVRESSLEPELRCKLGNFRVSSAAGLRQVLS
jgi:hypothetical protein